jgi:hypothetical protein
VLHQFRGGGLPGGHESGKHCRGQAERYGEFQNNAIDLDRRLLAVLIGPPCHRLARLRTRVTQIIKGELQDGTSNDS